MDSREDNGPGAPINGENHWFKSNSTKTILINVRFYQCFERKIMKLCSYDVEIQNELYTPEGIEIPLSDIIPSIAAYCLDDLKVKYFYDEPFMSKETAKKLVFEMMDHYKNGILPLTWNGTAFDFPLLGLYSGEIEACAILALNHIDMMFLVTCNKGYYLGLDTALRGMNVESKIHTVTLNNGTVLEGTMSGKIAPELWRKGEYEAVKTYLAGDVIQPIKLAQAIESQRKLFWFSKTGKPQSLYTNLIPVKECFGLPLPNVDWMSNPPRRSDFVKWIPTEILEKEFGQEEDRNFYDEFPCCGD